MDFPADWTITLADLGAYPTVPAETRAPGVALGMWGEDACMANEDPNSWAVATDRYGGGYENRQIADHPATPSPWSSK